MSGPVAAAVKAVIDGMIEAELVYDHAYRAWLPEVIKKGHYGNLGTEARDSLLMGGERYADFRRTQAARILESSDLQSTASQAED
jgi:hypothetical protein